MATDTGSSASRKSVVDIIIPVYRGLAETRRCLESVLAFPQQTAYELVVIDDCSPEPKLSTWLRDLAETGAITLLVNRVNTGFVNTVNRGMVLHPERDVVLLNSDTEVHGDWLDRLRRHTLGDPMIGTVTPFSNNATICSYPRFIQDNPLSEDWPLAKLDTLFAEVNAGQAVDIPTAVGFCMYVTRRCLEQVGYFDATVFNRGYGEENDFCLRGSELGFKHLLGTDIFVYHQGRVSFGSEHGFLIQGAMEKMRTLYPFYDQLIASHIAMDPARQVRRRVDWARIIRSSRPRFLFVTHQLGGGTEKHVQELAKLLEPKFEVFILRPNSIKGLSVEWARSGEEFIVYFCLPYNYQELLDFIKALGVILVHFHHMIGLNQQILQVVNDLNIPYYFTLHDYYPICPQYTLTLRNGNYCGEPDISGCNSCLNERPAPYGMDILSWRKLFSNILMGAKKVIAPSNDMMKRMRLYIPDANYVYLMHPEAYTSSPQAKACFTNSELKILVLGKLSLAKGLKLLEACAIDAKERKLPLYFRVIGTAENEVKKEPEIPLSFYGAYNDINLPLLIKRERADLIFFPALVPESYSYTLSYAICSGVPIAAPRIGAFQERLVEYPSARLIEWNSSAKCWNDLFMSLNKDLKPNVELIVETIEEENKYLKVYIQGFSEQQLSFIKNDYSLDFLDMLKCNYYQDNAPYGRRLDTLNRSELLALIRNLDLNKNNQNITTLEFVESINLLNKKVTDMEIEYHKKIGCLNEEVQKKDRVIEELNVETGRAKAEIRQLRDTIEEIYFSTSWRLTAPIRFIKKCLTKLSHYYGKFVLNNKYVQPKKNEDFITPVSSSSLDKNVFDRLAVAELTAFLADSRKIELPFSLSPKVSIILVLYNRAPLTFSCLKSIKASAEIPLEVLIINNASMDETQPLLERLEKVKIIHNTHNVGFLHACNQAAKIASGDTLLFLNNDAQLLPGSLSSALTSLMSSTTVGAVGGKIILLDGSLQEAGSIVWSDGSCSGYGRGDSPLAPMYMFRRNVDYCSGAFLLTRRQHFNELGGFDIDFAPAYYEETDYCFRLRQRGLLTIYDPNAVIVHYEFGSASLPDQGIKQQAINKNIFVEKHRNILEKHYGNSQENLLRARQATRSKHHVLFIDDRVPHPGLGQGFPRANSILSLLFEFDLFITLYPLWHPIEDWPSVYSDLPREVEVMIGHGLDKFRSFLQDRRGYYDIFFISRPHNMRLLQEIRKEQPALFDGVKIIYDAEAIFAAREILRAEIFDRSFSIMEKQKLIHSELEIASNVDAVITVSEMECSYFKDFGIINTYVLGHALIPKPTTNSFTARRNILFVGTITDDLSPNADSIIWFVKEVFPHIQRILGDDTTLLIAGSNKSGKVYALQCSNVKILGYIDNLYSLYNLSRIFIAPTRFAGGIPFKAHEAAAHGLPIVASTLIASQLGWKSGEDLLAAPTDNPAEFADHCIKLYSDPILWQKLRENSLRRIQLECSPKVFRQTLQTVVSNINDHLSC